MALSTCPEQSPVAVGPLTVAWATVGVAATHGLRRTWRSMINNVFAARVALVNTGAATTVRQVL